MSLDDDLEVHEPDAEEPEVEVKASEICEKCEFKLNNLGSCQICAKYSTCSECGSECDLFAQACAWCLRMPDIFLANENYDTNKKQKTEPNIVDEK